MDVIDILINYKQEGLDVSGVYITLSPVNMDSDEDSVSKDKGGSTDSLTGRQLRAGAEIALTDGQRISNKEKLRAAANSALILHHHNRSIN